MLAVVAAWLHFSSSFPPYHPPPYRPPYRHPPPEDAGPGWAFNFTRHGSNYALDDAKCEAAFPNLYPEIDRAVQHWRNKGGIKPSDLDTDWRPDAIRAMIYDNQLFIIETKGVNDGRWYQERHVASLLAVTILHTINRAVVTSPHPLPNIEFTITIADRADRTPNERPIWTFARRTHNEDHWLIPDFSFYSWPDVKAGSWAEFQKRIIDQDTALTHKDQRLVWRGALGVAPGLRGDLMRESQGHSWSDVLPLNWENKEQLKSRLLTMADHCRYMFTAHTEGVSYSGRLKYLLNCRSLTVIHELEWVQHYYHLLVPEGPRQNYVQVPRHFDNLSTTIEYYLKHMDRAQEVADNAVADFRELYLTPAAETCYWRRLFHGWASVSFEPSLYEKKAKSKNGERKWRGMAFESWVVKQPALPEKEA
ncbi:hypothetical protein K490DRAFT_50261 [Saccharata proteae CBS 121410]|uniref:Glycosyl transferase CAP10 domain-containing protein n=1 Tax=Saccharata proteae CBS 121410 TaxID=1314787 RepID=A0A9P4HQ91_9PEZI|nr:hypothetical protein K490DRAFT_50261 [Saccharata proteae CBS 121410]